ncbi:P-loop containing nucleoside triphosphate hydrolase protein [Stachybotrys elegans]|uniref:P-loop containing nucleoside triphosphate hydrolase protein n=1 Tax=Stachybotrys elegans TaxID=80388 RepID=A0A8K0WMX2_9HYPO|nr:P-loop containing nucleoside triphosphate hydrolase protein [Stachybotrys elegans]
MMARDLMSGRLPGLRSVFLSVVELVGNSAFDLLADRRPVALLEDTLGAIRVAGGEERHVKDEASLLALIEAAASLRRTASTQKNDTSSRSHAICRIRLQDEASSNADDGFLYLVDLAGSEAARDKTRHSADRLKETKDINLSLSVLKDCIRGRASLALHGGSGNPPAAAGRAAKTYIPFRQSALTKMLKHVFDPSTERQCRTVVVACVNPCLLDAGASKNTLRYAEMLRVEVPKPAAAAAYDAASPSTWSNSQLRRWIADNSGSPAISDFYLAPFETGKQLIQLPEAEFTSRCLQTPGVTSDQAAAFWTKFWSLHVDSKQAGGGGGGGGLQAHLLSSKDTRPEMAGVPFKQRIRPGMVVSWTATQGAPEHIALEKRNLALVLCAEGEGEGEGEAYRCCLVAKGLMKGSFGVFLWTQFAVRAADMEAEVLLQYDMATRLYYETL